MYNHHISKFIINLIFAYFFIILFLGITSTISFAKEPPKIKTQQFQSWTVRCVEAEKKEQCEMLQTLKVNQTNLQYTLAYNAFKNKSGKIKESLLVVVPLGVNLQKRIALRFDGKNQLNIPYSKCETFGCITTLNNNTKDRITLAVFDKIKKGFEESSFLEIAVQGFSEKPVVIKTSVLGFKNAYNNLKSKIN